MGYTHYWRREQNIEPQDYLRIVQDFHKLLPVFERNGVKLCGGLGEGKPEISEVEVCFNGDSNCGHQHFDLGIAWPSPKAQGIAVDGKPTVGGGWFAGAQIDKRCCGGDCSHETFSFPLRLKPEKWQKPEKGKYFAFCKTAYKPYDWAVISFLVIAKHYLGDKILVHSDGELAQWQDAILLCQLDLGYGMEFKLDD